MKAILRAHKAWIIFCGAILLRFVAITVVRAKGMHLVTLEYEDIALNWLHGKGFIYPYLGTIYRSFPNPLYTFLCMAMYKILGHHHVPILMMQAVFSGLLSVCIYYIGSRVDKKTGLLAALLTIVHPGIFYYDLFYLHGLSLDSFLFAFIVLMFMRLKQDPTILNQIGTGVALGAQIYERGTVSFFIFPALIWLYYFSVSKESLISWLKKSITIIIVMTLLVAPWVIRNFAIHKELVAICTPIGELLWRGNNPLATGAAYTADRKPMLWDAPREFQDKIAVLDEIGQMHAFRQEAFRFIKESPSRFVFLTFKKMKLFWWFSPLTGIDYNFKYLGVVKSLYPVLVFFEIWGIILIVRSKVRRDLAALVVILLLAVTLGQSLFYVQQKHRWALEPLLFIFVAHAILHMAGKIKYTKSV